jgi:hypothetical protein
VKRGGGEEGRSGEVKGRGGGGRSRAAMSKGEETNTHVFQMQKPAMILRDNGLLIHSDHQRNA